MTTTKDHLTPLGDAADRLDELADLNTEFMREWQYGLLSRAVGGSGTPGGDVARVIGWAMPGASTKFRGAVQFGVDNAYDDFFAGRLLKGTIDVLRIGDGVSEGTAWGFVSDGLRLAAIIPVARSGSNMVRRGMGAWRATAVIQSENVANCTWTAAQKLLRMTGIRPFATMRSLKRAVQATGLNVGPNTNAVEVNEIVGGLRRLGANTSHLGVESLTGLQKATRANPHGAAIFSIEFMTASGGRMKHSLLSRAGKFLDTYGDVFHSIEELRRIYPGATLCLESGSYFVHNAVILEPLLPAIAGLGVAGSSWARNGRTSEPWLRNMDLDSYLALPLQPVAIQIRGTGPTLLSLYPPGKAPAPKEKPNKGGFPEGYVFRPDLMPNI
jgi:hypothetical protein